MHKDKWFAIFMCVVALTIGSCGAFDNYNNTRFKIAQLECQKVTNED